MADNKDRQPIKNPMPDRCVACGGELMDDEDYEVRLRWKRCFRTVPLAMAICAVWSPIFCLVRLGLGGGFANVAGGAGAFLISTVLSKILVGAVLGLLVGICSGVWKGEVGLFLGMVIGVIGAFFVAASPALPLRPEAEFRNGLVAVSIVGGLLLAATGYLVEKIARSRWGDAIGPEPFDPNAPEEG